MSDDEEFDILRVEGLGAWKVSKVSLFWPWRNYVGVKLRGLTVLKHDMVNAIGRSCKQFSKQPRGSGRVHVRADVLMAQASSHLDNGLTLLWLKIQNTRV